MVHSAVYYDRGLVLLLSSGARRMAVNAARVYSIEGIGVIGGIGGIGGIAQECAASR